MDKIIQLNDKLIGLPAGVLVFIMCIAVGYMVKMTERIHNNSIPLVVMLAGVILFALMAPSKSVEMPYRIWIVTNLCIGGIIGFAAWMSHKLVIKRIEDKLGLFSGDGPDDKPKPPPGSLTGTIQALICAFSFIGFTGCASLTSREALPAKLKAVAYIGTAEALRAHPEWKPAFVTAALNLKLIEASETLDMITVVAVLQSLPIKELKGERAVIYVTAATLLLDDATLQVKNPAQAREIASALRAGIELGSR